MNKISIAGPLVVAACLSPVTVQAGPVICTQVDGKISCSGIPSYEAPRSYPPQSLPLGSSGGGIDWSRVPLPNNSYPQSLGSSSTKPPNYGYSPPNPSPYSSPYSSAYPSPYLPPYSSPSVSAGPTYLNPHGEFRSAWVPPPPPTINIPDVSQVIADMLAPMQASLASVHAGAMARASFWYSSTKAMAALKKKVKEENSKAREELQKSFERLPSELMTSLTTIGVSVNQIEVGISAIALDPATSSQQVSPLLVPDSVERDFRTRLKSAADRAVKISPQHAYQERAQLLAVSLLSASIRQAREGDSETAELLLALAEVMLDVGTGITPGIGFARDVYEALTGINAITGQPLSEWEQAVAAVSVATAGTAGRVIHAEKALAQLASITQRLLRNKAFLSTERFKVVRRAYAMAEEVLHARKMEANVRYQVGGYYYFMDELGRLREVRGELRLERMATDSYQQRAVRDSMGKLGDDAGHIIGARFGGVAERFNLVPMDAGLNRGAYRDLESTWARALTEGKPVSIQVKPLYDDATFRPLYIEVKYKIDGVPIDLTYRNSKIP